MSENSGNTPETPPPSGVNAGPEQKLFETTLAKRDRVVIGRGTECDVIIQDVKASRRHCQLTRNEDGYVLEDLGSRNGTFVDGVKISGAVALKSKQTFKVGDTVFYLA